MLSLQGSVQPKWTKFSPPEEKTSSDSGEELRKLVHPVPATYGIGGDENYYFSHMLNCLYDCRYCFLQGCIHLLTIYSL